MIALFINVKIVDVIDVLLVAFLLYQVYNLVKGTTAINIFFGIITVYIIYLLVDALQMRLLSKILGQFVGVGVLALIVVFQQEIRRFLLVIGNSWLNNRLQLVKRFLPKKLRGSRMYAIDLTELNTAIRELVQTQTGALIVLMKQSELRYYIKSGIPIEARLTSQMVQNIFFKNSPLHDGAIIIKGHIIKAARCILPLSEKTDFPEGLGLRHRAAVGITEVSDAVAIMVSEQTQQVSIAHHGELYPAVPLEMLQERLEKILAE